MSITMHGYACVIEHISQNKSTFLTHPQKHLKALCVMAIHIVVKIHNLSITAPITTWIAAPHISINCPNLYLIILSNKQLSLSHHCKQL